VRYVRGSSRINGLLERFVEDLELGLDDRELVTHLGDAHRGARPQLARPEGRG
jgi:hypothetical protein